MHIRTKDLPKVGAFGHARNFLYKERLWEIAIKFVDSINNLGCSYDDRERVEVRAFGPNGIVGGWKGSYGGSSAMMFNKSKEALAASGQLNLENIPEGTVVLEITRHYKKSWVRMYVNSSHQAFLLSPPEEGIDLDRIGKILKVFSSLISSARQTPLHGLRVSEEEFKTIVENGWLKCNKGKLPKRLDKPILINGPYDLYKYYDLNGARITTEGKNILER